MNNYVKIACDAKSQISMVQSLQRDGEPSKFDSSWDSAFMIVAMRFFGSLTVKYHNKPILRGESVLLVPEKL